MSFHPRVHQAIEAQTINANGNSGALPNLGRGLNPTILALLDLPNAPTGTTPSLTVNVQGSYDGVRFTTIASFTAQTAQTNGPVRLVLNNVLEPYVQVSWTITGAGATFTGVNCFLLFAPPDA